MPKKVFPRGEFIVNVVDGAVHKNDKIFHVKGPEAYADHLYVSPDGEAYIHTDTGCSWNVDNCRANKS